MDTPETLAAAMLEAAAQASFEALFVVRRGAKNIKRDAQANVLKSAPIHNANAASAITYESKAGGSSLSPSAEIGYDKDRKPGRIGNLLEFGGGKDHSPPHRDLGRALDAEQPRFEQAIAALTEKLL